MNYSFNINISIICTNKIKTKYYNKIKNILTKQIYKFEITKIIKIKQRIN